MAEVYKTLGQQQVPNSATTIYTVPGATQAIVKCITVVNPETAGGAATIKIWQGGNTDGKMILPAISLGVGEWAEWEGSREMATGDTIQAVSDTNNRLTITISGGEFT